VKKAQQGDYMKEYVPICRTRLKNKENDEDGMGDSDEIMQVILMDTDQAYDDVEKYIREFIDEFQQE
jgi:hypothetical protein